MAKQLKFYFLWLSLACVIMFILQSIIPGFTEKLILDNHALHGEYWRFISAIFLHAGIVHLIYNLFALLLFGFILEKTIGSERFLALFFVSGIIANLVSVWFYSSSLGASGAIYGILGVLIIIRPMMMVWAFGLVMPMFIAGIVWIAAGLIGLFIPSDVGDIAHLSGVGVGILFGLFLRLNKKKEASPIKLEIPESYIQSWEDYHMK
jgi:membrane associated rhomboid family serine protease